MADSLAGVIESGMCVACGACCAADPSVALALAPARQIFQPTSTGGVAAASVCPSIEVDYADLQEFVFGQRDSGPLGLVDSIHLAQSTDEARNRNASSGGLIKEAIRYLLESGTTGGVISIAHDQGLEYRARIIRDPQEIDSLPGSIYHNINLESALALIEANDEPLGVVAIPCQLEGIYKYVSTCKPHVKERIAFTIGLLCAWQYSRHSIAAISAYSGVDPALLSDVAYRGGDMIGKLRLRLGDGREHSIDRRANLNYQIAFDRYFNTPRCNVCVNHTNFLADLVVGDSWMQSTRFTRTGISIAIARTPRATAALRDMERNHQIVLHQVGEKELIESEGESLVYGEFAYAFADLLREEGLHAPELRGPNRGRGRQAPRSVVAAYLAELRVREELMAKGRYWAIWRRKLLREGHRIAMRYLKWFINRALKLKSLTGRDRDLDRSELSGKFR